MHDQVEVRNWVTGATGFMPASAVQNFYHWVLIDDPDPSGDGEQDDGGEQDDAADQQDPSDPPEDTEQAPASGRPRSKRSSRS